MAPAPLPEHDFNRLLADHGCYGAPKGGEFVVYRKIDDKMVCQYGVDHSSGSRREVKPFYIKRFLNRIKDINEQEAEAKANLQTTPKEEKSYLNSDWYKESMKYQDLQEEQEAGRNEE